MIKSFIYCWLGYWLLVLLLPVHSIYPAVTEAFLLQLGFVLLVCLGYAAAYVIAPRVRVPTAFQGAIPFPERVMRFSIVMSLAGFAFLVFDKVFIQHIDYSSGLAVAREQWRNLGEDREGKASSVWSALGYLFSSAYYVMLVLAIAQPGDFSSRRRLRIVGIAFLFALTNSIITGGRSNFLLIVAVAIAAFSSRSGLNIRDVFTSGRQRQYVAGIMVLAMCYIVYVFYSRAEAGGQVVYWYVSNFLPVMGLEMDEWYAESVKDGWIGAMSNMGVLVMGYLSHSFATTAAIIDAPQEDKIMLLSNFTSILYKLGLVARPDDQWFLAGKFPSVPGALWHEFGPIGLIAGSLSIGVASAFSKIWASTNQRRMLPLAAYVLMGATLILTPFVFAPDLLSFPFVVSAFGILAVLSRFRFRLTLDGASVQYVVPKPRSERMTLVGPG
jgi:hypothetical protein